MQDVIKFPETLNYNFHFLHCGFENGADLEKKSSYYERFVISYLIDGRGTVTMDGKSFSIEKGDLYFIVPSLIAQKTTKANPYQYYYVAISGPDCEEIFVRAGYSKGNPVIKLNDDFVKDLMEDICNTSRDLSFSSMLKMRISFLQLLEYLYDKNKQNTIPISNKPSLLVESIKQYIEMNYQNSFLISNLVEMMHYTQPYLSRVFKEKCGKTIKAYITEFRINKACYLLRNSALNVLEIALEVGFQDVSTFCRAFKRCKGCSPKKFGK
ncbi:MAG: helix-turn-helix domain-containing protein [Clostridia bacterium]|nr:helix-turn-helix domain-containing protein [Clostridia bacterium]